MLHGNVFSGSLFGLGASQAEVDAAVAQNAAATFAYDRSNRRRSDCQQKERDCASALTEKRRREAAFQAAYDNYTRVALPAYTATMLNRARKIAQRGAELWSMRIRDAGVPNTGPTGDLAWAMRYTQHSISDAGRAQALEACKSRYTQLRGLGAMSAQEETQRLYGAGVMNPCFMAILPSAPPPAQPQPPLSPDFSDLGECLTLTPCPPAPEDPVLVEVPDLDDALLAPMTDTDEPVYTVDPPAASAPSSGMSTGLLLLLGAVVVGGGTLVYLQTRKKGGGA